MMSQLRGSQQFIWNVSDVLGQGATGAVYKARHKHTGELYAVKTFNQLSYIRSPIVQAREFEVLRRLNHENIVRLLYIEKESSTGADVLVMELCTGGSLFNLLDDPENAFGIEEKEFKQVLSDVANGMKHLRDREIVHRDIKPGNIMRYINEDGRSIYKLIDFGAARELQDEEQFQSLYGTEEYLYPDMYERAVLKRPTGKQFSAMVDLWSLGVTLYHVATGQLPFRPYGGRRNKETMYRITSEKASGVISGVQHSNGGSIEWSRNLPSNCRLSMGMRQLITPVLAHLLESNPEKMMKFDDFFESANDIKNKHVVYVFDMNRNFLLHIYANQNDQFARFQELIAEQSGVRMSDQQLLFENHELEKIVKALQPLSSYPHTSTQNPIYLFSIVHDLASMSVTCCVPALPQFSSEVLLDEDASLAKQCCATVYFVHRVIVDILLKQQLIGRAAKMYLLVLSREIEHNRDLVAEFFQRVEEMGRRLQLLNDSHSILTSILNDKIKSRPDEDERKRLLKSVKNIFDLTSINTEKERFKQLHSDVSKMKDDIESLHSQVSTNVLLWIEKNGCKDCQGCILKADVLLNAVKQTALDFARDRNLKKLSFNEEQIHKFEKHKLKGNSAKALSLVHNDCYPNTVKMFDEFLSWYSLILRFQHQLQSLKSVVSDVSEKQEKLSETLSQTQESRHEKLKSLLNELEIVVEPVGATLYEKNPAVSSNGLSIVFSSKRSATNKEMRELINAIRSKVEMNASITNELKNATEENVKLINCLEQRQLGLTDFQDPECNYSTEEPLTLMADK